MLRRILARARKLSQPTGDPTWLPPSRQSHRWRIESRTVLVIGVVGLTLASFSIAIVGRANLATPVRKEPASAVRDGPTIPAIGATNATHQIAADTERRRAGTALLHRWHSRADLDDPQPRLHVVGSPPHLATGGYSPAGGIDRFDRGTADRGVQPHPNAAMSAVDRPTMLLAGWWSISYMTLASWLTVLAMGTLLVWLHRRHKRERIDRSDIEAALRSDEALYRILFDRNPLPMYMADLASLRLLAVNDAMVDCYGWSRAELLEMTALDIRPAEDVPRLLTAIEGRPVDETRTIAGVRHRRKDGTMIDVETISRVAEIGGRRLLIVLVRDVTERNRAQAALRENDRRLRLAVESSRIGLWEWELAANGFIPSVEAVRLLGYGDGEAPAGIALWESGLHPDDRERLCKAIEAWRAEPVREFVDEFRLRHQDGTYRWVETRARLVVDDLGTPLRYLGCWIDITVRRQSEEIARETAVRLQLAASSGNIGLWDWNLRTNTVYYSLEWKRQLGFEEHEIAPNLTEWECRLHPDDRERALDATRSFIEGIDQEYRVEFRLRHKDGSYRWILSQGALLRDALGVPVRMLGSHIDLTLRKKMETALAESESRLLALMENVPMAVTLKDLDGRYLFVNRRFSQWHGATIQDVLGRTMTDVFPERDRAPMVAQEAALLAGEGPRKRIEMVTFCDGTKHCVEILEFLVPGPVPAICSMAADVTQQRKMGEQLRQAQKMEAIGQLTGGIAHDFNNLLTVIIGNSELLTTALGDNPALKRLAEITGIAAARGAELTRSLLVYARQQKLEPRPTAINELLRRMHGLLGRALGERVEIALHCRADIQDAIVDPGQLEAAILNLAVNARDAMPAGGRLTIETANVELGDDDARRNEGVKPGSYVLISVEDTGAGMTPDVLARAFDPFFTTKEVGKGTGLGLSMVLGFAKQSNGHVKIYSEPGHGTVVRLYLPCTAGVAVKGATSALASDLPRGGETILLAEDDALVRAQAESQLASLGYRVIAVRNGTEALEVLRRPESIDLLFTDVIMPGGLSGLELVEAARQVRPALRVLLTTGFSQNGIGGSVPHAGTFEILQKPYRKADLAARLRQVLDADRSGR